MVNGFESIINKDSTRDRKLEKVILNINWKRSKNGITIYVSTAEFEVNIFLLYISLLPKRFCLIYEKHPVESKIIRFSNNCEDDYNQIYHNANHCSYK